MYKVTTKHGINQTKRESFYTYRQKVVPWRSRLNPPMKAPKSPMRGTFSPWNDDDCALERWHLRLGAMATAPWSNDNCALEQWQLCLGAIHVVPRRKKDCPLERRTLLQGTIDCYSGSQVPLMGDLGGFHWGFRRFYFSIIFLPSTT